MQYRATGALAQAVLGALIAVSLSGLQLRAFEVTSGEPKTLSHAAHFPWMGRRINSNLDILEFRAPHFAHIKMIHDVDYVEYYILHGPSQNKTWLRLMFGGNVGGYTPDALTDAAIRWTSRKLICDGMDVGTDWRGSGADGREWRHLGIPFGFAEYKGVSKRAAAYFDKVLDSVSCGKCKPCNP